MSNLLIGFLAAAGIAAWVYSKMHRSTGGNTQNALIVAGAAGIATWVMLIMILNSVL